MPETRKMKCPRALLVLGGALCAVLYTTTTSLETVLLIPHTQYIVQGKKQQDTDPSKNKPVAKMIKEADATNGRAANDTHTAASSSNNTIRSCGNISNTVAVEKRNSNNTTRTAASSNRGNKYSSPTMLPTLENASSPQRRFPHWKDGSISFASVLRFLDAMLEQHNFFLPDNNTDFPATLYMIQNSSISTSRVIRQHATNPRYGYRYQPTERMFRLALQRLHDTNTTRWPALRRVLSNSGSVPFLAWYGDFKGCQFHNWRDDDNDGTAHSIPIFTTCARVDCEYAFPIPQYMTIQSSRTFAASWQATFVEQNTHTYPWPSKLPQVVWRGGLTGALRNYTSPRWRIGVLGATARKSNSPLLDVGITYYPDRYETTIPPEQRAQLEPLADTISPMGDFQKYQGILDIDGNSWSSRFGLLLCYNSVILKVEPMYVDYFFDTLEPWVHYIPVANDLSDLEVRAAWMTDPRHEHTVRTIVANANLWCQLHMIEDAVADDMLNVWDAYVQLLDRHDDGSSWQSVWKAQQATYGAAYDMFPIES